MKAWQATIERIDQAGIYPEHRTVTQGINQPICLIDGKPYLTFASNNYLGLSYHPSVVAAAQETATTAGVGPGNSRVIGGTSKQVAELERAIAAWTGFEDCVVFPTGYMANVSVVRGLVSPLFPDQTIGDSIVFVDQLIHGSIVDGCRCAGAKVVPFRHNQPEDLTRKLMRYREVPNKLVITEGVFCLEGTTIHLPAYVAIAEEHGAMLMVDDAHGIGIVGPEGGGIARLFGLQNRVDVYMGCLDKALGGTGGFLCGSNELIRYLRVGCRGAILSSAMPTMLAGAMVEAVRLARIDQIRRDYILTKADRLKEMLRAKGFTTLGEHRHPAVAVLIGPDELGLQLSRQLWEQGIFQPIMRWPAVPQNCSRLRLSVTFDHTSEHLERMVATLVSRRAEVPN